MDTQISRHFDIRDFVSPDTWDKWGKRSIQFIQARIINTCELLYTKISKEYNIDIDNIEITINNWYKEDGGSQLNGYHSGHSYISRVKKDIDSLTEDDYDSFHRQGHCVKLKCVITEDNERKMLSSYDIASVILESEDDFILEGLTVISEPRKYGVWLHLDCRNTRSFKLKIISG